jgi:hypothetical protein
VFEVDRHGAGYASTGESGRGWRDCEAGVIPPPTEERGESRPAQSYAAVAKSAIEDSIWPLLTWALH